jgi:23S rRNA pseudouridine2457 synthase
MRLQALSLLFLSFSAIPTDALSSNDVANQQCYIALYKPVMMLCSLNDDEARAQRKNRERRQTLADLAALPAGLHTVGRLDRDSEGLLLLTNDGMFTHVVHTTCEKRYWALVKGIPDESALTSMGRGGLTIRGADTQPPISVRHLQPEDFMLADIPKAAAGIRDRGDPSSWLEIVLMEGRHRQIRRITAAAGHPTIRLVRVGIGSLGLDGLKPAEWRFIEKSQVLGENTQVDRHS